MTKTKPSRRVALAGLLAAGTLGPAARAQQAEMPQRPGYLVVFGRSSDPVALRTYSAALPPIYASHGGTYLGLGGQGRGVNWVSGPIRDRSLVLAVFPSIARVQDFWWSEPYRAAIRLRDRVGVFTVNTIEGLGPVPHQGAGAAYLLVLYAATDARRADAAAAAHMAAVTASGGTMMTSTAAGAPVALEGDTPFDRLWLAAWPDAAGRERFLTSRPGRTAARLRDASGIAAVATLDALPIRPAASR